MFTNEQLFQIALGIEKPLSIEKIDFDKETGELHIHIDFEKGGTFKCSVCGKEDLKARDTVEKVWRHLDFFQYKTYLHFRTPRTDCPEHGVRLIDVPWARRSSGFTMLFEALIITLATQMSISEIATLVKEHDTRIWRIVRGYVNKAYKELSLETVEKIGVDETSKTKGHNYVTVFADMSTRKVIYVTEGKKQDTIEKFAEELPNHKGNPEQIKEVSMDMSPSFIAGIKNNLKNASITFDKFHVVKHLNEAIDEIRRTEQAENPLLKNSRYVWLKNPNNLKASEKTKLEGLNKEKLKTGRAYRMKLVFQDIYNSTKDIVIADGLIKKWLSWAVRSRLEPIKKFAKMVKSHYKGILRYFESGLTNATMESINSRIQEAKRRAKGYRNVNNFITMIYLEAAGLDVNVFSPTHSK